MKLTAIVLVTLCTVSALTGCNTMYGLGQDISSVGDAIKHTAEKTKP